MSPQDELVGNPAEAASPPFVAPGVLYAQRADGFGRAWVLVPNLHAIVVSDGEHRMVSQTLLASAGIGGLSRLHALSKRLEEGKAEREGNLGGQVGASEAQKARAVLPTGNVEAVVGDRFVILGERITESCRLRIEPRVVGRGRGESSGFQVRKILLRRDSDELQ